MSSQNFFLNLRTHSKVFETDILHVALNEVVRGLSHPSLGSKSRKLEDELQLHIIYYSMQIIVPTTV
jgi:hypothetical protein